MRDPIQKKNVKFSLKSTENNNNPKKQPTDKAVKGIVGSNSEVLLRFLKTKMKHL